MTSAKRFSVPLLAVLALLIIGVMGPGSAAQAAQPDSVKVIIAFNKAPGPDEHALVRAAGGNVKWSYSIVPAVAASVPQQALDGLRRNPRVARVEVDVQVFASDAELSNSWGVAQIGAGSLHGSNTGSGVKIGVIDSGLDYRHPDLAGNYVDGYDFYNDDDDPMDDNGHGTHVAGTIAALDNGQGVVGVAPGAKLYAYKVLGASGSGYFSDIVMAVEQAVSDGVLITNNSYGSSTDPGVTVQQAFDKAFAAGVLHVAAAGNKGNKAGKGDNVGYPAKYGSVVAVAATDKNNKRASFSSTGPAVEISAPGVGINSTRVGGGHTTMSGTSMASPHVAGAAALVIADGATGPANVRSRLTGTARDLGTSGRDSLYGYGLVDTVGVTAP